MEEEYLQDFIYDISNWEATSEIKNFLEENNYNAEVIPEAKLMVLQKVVNNPTDPKWDTSATGVYANNPALAYDAIYTLPGTNGTEVMYRMTNHKQSLLVTTSPKLINGTVATTIAPSDSPLGDGLYYYMYDNDTSRYYEYGLPIQIAQIYNCLSCSLEQMFQAVLSNSLIITGRYFLPVEDIFILITGDDFEGVKSSRAVAGGFLLVDLIPGATAIKAIKLIKYGDEAIELAAVTVKYIDSTYRSQIQIIEEVLEGIQVLSNNTKRGDFGEIVIDVDLYERGYQLLNRNDVIDLSDTSIHTNGIDHIIKNDAGDFESKYQYWSTNEYRLD